MLGDVEVKGARDMLKHIIAVRTALNRAQRFKLALASTRPLAHWPAPIGWLAR